MVAKKMCATMNAVKNEDCSALENRLETCPGILDALGKKQRVISGTQYLIIVFRAFFLCAATRHGQLESLRRAWRIMLRNGATGRWRPSCATTITASTWAS